MRFYIDSLCFGTRWWYPVRNSHFLIDPPFDLRLLRGCDKPQAVPMINLASAAVIFISGGAVTLTVKAFVKRKLDEYDESMEQKFSAKRDYDRRWRGDV